MALIGHVDNHRHFHVNNVFVRRADGSCEKFARVKVLTFDISPGPEMYSYTLVARGTMRFVARPS